ncbi:hypothetical protein AFK68_19670 [Hydrocoleum sp. CS-953]|nr:hypothetical protein AFK68_19670 [Hydrocoleum sp. CS-953]
MNWIALNRQNNLQFGTKKNAEKVSGVKVENQSRWESTETFPAGRMQAIIACRVISVEKFSKRACLDT